MQNEKREEVESQKFYLLPFLCNQVAFGYFICFARVNLLLTKNENCFIFTLKSA